MWQSILVLIFIPFIGSFTVKLAQVRPYFIWFYIIVNRALNELQCLYFIQFCYCNFKAQFFFVHCTILTHGLIPVNYRRGFPPSLFLGRSPRRTSNHSSAFRLPRPRYAAELSPSEVNNPACCDAFHLTSASPTQWPAPIFSEQCS